MNYLYTHNDLDGVACGIVARCAFGKRVDVRYNSVSSLDAQIGRFLEKHRGKPKRGDGMLFVTDLTVNAESEEGLARYVSEGGRVRLLDHHRTALHLNRNAWANVQLAYDDGRLTSAASLLYEYLVQHGLLPSRRALSQFVELVRQYDTWEWERRGNTRAKRLNDLFYIMSPDEFEETMIERVQREDDFEFTEFEEKLLELEEEKIERYVRRKRRELTQTFVGERCVGVVYAESYHSELGSTLGKEFPHLDYIAILNPGGKKISLRTVRDDVDVSEVAGEFGGGGHAKAAGCPMTEAAFRLYAAEPFALEPLRGDTNGNQYNVKASPFGVLYESRSDDWLFLFTSEGRWHIDANGETLDESFDSFEKAERFVKRKYAAWLTRDEAFVQYLMKHAGKR